MAGRPVARTRPTWHRSCSSTPARSLAVHAWEAWKDDLDAVPRLPLVARYATFVGLAYLTLLFGEFGGSQFIYFQF